MFESEKKRTPLFNKQTPGQYLLKKHIKFIKLFVIHEVFKNTLFYIYISINGIIRPHIFFDK